MTATTPRNALLDENGSSSLSSRPLQRVSHVPPLWYVPSPTRTIPATHDPEPLVTHNNLFFQAAMARPGLQKEFGVSTPVAILGISLFVAGLGIGPLLLGPLSEFFGRRHIYWISFVFFVLFNFPVAFAPNIGASVAADSTLGAY